MPSSKLIFQIDRGGKQEINLYTCNNARAHSGAA